MAIHKLPADRLDPHYCQLTNCNEQQSRQCCATQSVLNNTFQGLQSLAVPVPLRHWTAVVKPLVLGNRWYFSLGNPLDSATSILMRCLVSVKRVPSQYSRNCARQKKKKTQNQTQGYLEISKEIQQYTGIFFPK